MGGELLEETVVEVVQEILGLLVAVVLELWEQGLLLFQHLGR